MQTGLLYRKPVSGGGETVPISVSNAIDAGVAGVTITPSASANTKGNYAQLTASTASAATWMMVSIWVNQNGATTNSWLVDIAKGAAASETVIVPNLGASTSGQFGQNVYTYFFPINVAAGTRIAARCQTNTGTSPEACFVKATLFGGANIAGNGIDSLSASTTTSRGAPVTPGANNVKGAYGQIIASTSREYKGIFGVMDSQGSQGSYGALVMDLATGAAASESIILPNFRYVSGGFNPFGAQIPFLPFTIPAGTRISARMADTAGGPVAQGVSLYGVY